jgi:hypothetical protein
MGPGASVGSNSQWEIQNPSGRRNTLSWVSNNYVGAAVGALIGFGTLVSVAAVTNDVIIRLRLSGESETLSPLRSCLVERLSQMPDTKVAVVPTDGARFIVDIVVTKDVAEAISASLVVVQTFPMEQFRPRIKEGEDATALLKSIQYYTLLRLHEAVPAQPSENLCTRIAADISDKVLSQEYTERND